MIKLKYEAAKIEVYDLEKKDVLLSSTTIDIPVEEPTEETIPILRENSYVSFFDLF